MSLKVRRLSYALGAEILGVDIHKPMDDATVAGVRAAFLEHCIVLFRGEPLTRAQHVAFSRQLGDVDMNDVVRPGKTAEEFPEVGVVINKNISKPDANSSSAYHTGMYWHSDRSYLTTPSRATLLHALVLPEVGGDTMFTNCYLGYETLSDGMKKMLEGLYCAHVRDERYHDRSSPEALQEAMRVSQAAQPLVRVHPETGRKSLFLGEDNIKHIIGMTAEESAPLLRYLHQHASRPQFVYRHRWQVGDLIMWDNRCTMHNALGDYDKSAHMRHLEKTYLRGTPSGYPYPPQ